MCEVGSLDGPACYHLENRACDIRSLLLGIQAFDGILSRCAEDARGRSRCESKADKRVSSQAPGREDQEQIGSGVGGGDERLRIDPLAYRYDMIDLLIRCSLFQGCSRKEISVNPPFVGYSAKFEGLSVNNPLS